MKQRNIFFLIMVFGVVAAYHGLCKADNENDWVGIELEEERTEPVEGEGEEEEYILVGGVRSEEEEPEEGEGVQQIEGEGEIEPYYE